MASNDHNSIVSRLIGGVTHRFCSERDDRFICELIDGESVREDWTGDNHFLLTYKNLTGAGFLIDCSRFGDRYSCDYKVQVKYYKAGGCGCSPDGDVIDVYDGGVDVPIPDAGDGGPDSPQDAGRVDGSYDAGDAGGVCDAGDASVISDAGDAGVDGGGCIDAGVDAGTDAGDDGGSVDAGPIDGGPTDGGGRVDGGSHADGGNGGDGGSGADGGGYVYINDVTNKYLTLCGYEDFSHVQRMSKSDFIDLLTEGRDAGTAVDYVDVSIHAYLSRQPDGGLPPEEPPAECIKLCYYPHDLSGEPYAPCTPVRSIPIGGADTLAYLDSASRFNTVYNSWSLTQDDVALASFEAARVTIDPGYVMGLYIDILPDEGGVGPACYFFFSAYSCQYR